MHKKGKKTKQNVNQAMRVGVGGRSMDRQSGLKNGMCSNVISVWLKQQLARRKCADLKTKITGQIAYKRHLRFLRCNQCITYLNPLLLRHSAASLEFFKGVHDDYVLTIWV